MLRRDGRVGIPERITPLFVHESQASPLADLRSDCPVDLEDRRSRERRDVFQHYVQCGGYALRRMVEYRCAGGSLAFLSAVLSFHCYRQRSGSGDDSPDCQCPGAGDSEQARYIFAQSLLFALIAGIIFSGIGFLVAPTIFTLLGASGAYLTATLAYMNVILLGGIFFILSMTLNSALSAQVRTDIYRNLLLMALAANCALNPLLMWGLLGLPKLGVAGIALSTVIVQIAESFLLWHFLKKSGPFASLQAKDLKPNWAILKQIAAQAIPAALNMVTIALGVFVITWFVKQFGKEAVAATGIATRIEQIVLMPVIGLSTAVLSIVGQSHGAGLHARVRETWKINLLLGVGLMSLGSVGVLLFGQSALRIFTSNPIVLHDGWDYLTAEIFTLPAYPILFVTVFMMQGLKRPLYGLWIGIYRQIVAPIIVFHLFAFTLGWGLWGIWWGFCIVTWSAALFALAWGWHTVRTKNSHLLPLQVESNLLA